MFLVTGLHSGQVGFTVEVSVLPPANPLRAEYRQSRGSSRQARTSYSQRLLYHLKSKSVSIHGHGVRTC
jgi:hypothetical protein